MSKNRTTTDADAADTAEQTDTSADQAGATVDASAPAPAGDGQAAAPAPASDAPATPHAWNDEYTGQGGSYIVVDGKRQPAP